MARIRTIKPEFFRHEGLYEAEKTSGFPLRVAFAGLWTVADREGRFRWAPRALKLDCLPYDELDFSRVLDALATRGFIVKYTVGGVDYGSIPSFTQHQVINNRELQSNLPPPSGNNNLTREARVDDAKATPLKQDQGEGKGKEGKGKEGKGKEIDEMVEARAREPSSNSKFTPGSKILAEAFWRALGYASAIEIPPELSGVDWRAVEWERAGWTVDLICSEATRLARDRPLKPLAYFEKVFATAFAKRQAPLPVVEIREAEKLTVTHGPGKPQVRPGSLIAAIDRELASLQSQEETDLELPKGPVQRLSS